MLEGYIHRDDIQDILIRIRCKYADQRNRAGFATLLSTDPNDTCHIPDIYNLFPPRRKWCTLKREERKSRTECTSIDNNFLSLSRSIHKELCNKEKHPIWYDRLGEAIDDIYDMAFSDDLKFTSLRVVAEEKDRDEEEKTITCRPICNYKNYKERTIISLYNKAMTRLFDGYFHECSFAFRLPKKGETDKTPAHIKAVKQIVDFRRKHEGTLWVAECDLKKFYDTIDHDVIMDTLEMMLRRSVEDNKIDEKEAGVLRRVMQAYMDSYNFYESVLQYNSDQSNQVWKPIPKRSGYNIQFKWIEKDIAKQRKAGWPYRTEDHDQHYLGVPQGGALSGLIANLILNRVDEQIMPFVDKDKLIYLRFCDDMIIIGKDEHEVRNAFNVYRKAIESLHLYQHNPEGIEYPYTKNHWESKTKEPYKWDDINKDGIPWVSFVGIDVRWSGDARIRKKTIHKHMKKQESVVWDVLREIKSKAPRYDEEKTQKILQGHLDAMGVGRIRLWNYKDNPNVGSWSCAFEVIDNNRWSRYQLKNLDRHKKQVLRKFKKKIKDINFPQPIISYDSKRSWRHNPEMKGMPCSYYGQILKPWK